MTIKEFIKGKFKGFGVQITDADLLDMCFSSRINEEGEMDAEVYNDVRKAIVRFIPSLLLRPSISEGGFSLTIASRDNIVAYYSTECESLGILNRLKPKVTFL